MKKFQLFQKLNKNQQNIFLLGMFNANVRSNKTEKKRKKVYVTSDYYFKEIKICMGAFLIIYSIRKKRWEAIHKHFSVNDITSIVYSLTSQKNNNAISFETILQILTFITNYANVHELLLSGIFY